MIAVVQRVSSAQVTTEGSPPARIGRGLLILLGVARGDTATDAQWLAKKCLSLRIFNDEQQRMNLSLADVGGELLAVSQFTLLGNCIKGRRPSWSEAADPGEAKELYDSFVSYLREGPHRVRTGIFQAMMEVESINDGPVTLLIDSADWQGRKEGGASPHGADFLLGHGLQRLYLCSRSPRRARLLEMLGVSFEVRFPDEDVACYQAGQDPGQYAINQATDKALSVAGKIKRGIALGADTVVNLGGEILEKPSGPDEAIGYLSRLAGQEHEVLTGICLATAGGGSYLSAVERTRVRMTEMDQETIQAYVKTGEPLDKAGAYGIQGIGGMLVTGVEGCYFNVMGLPLAKLRSLMREMTGERQQ